MSAVYSVGLEFHPNAINSLCSFVESWRCLYELSIRRIPLFNLLVTGKCSAAQKSLFVKLFYHARGHFHDFLWYMGNHAPDEPTKNIILQNISEEFGRKKYSHEKLYLGFAEALHTPMEDEMIEEPNYRLFLRNFNLGHLRWLRMHDWASNLAAFAAYERLDNIDYANLLELARSFEVSSEGLQFFVVHMSVCHFESTLDHLSGIWQSNAPAVREAFAFIAEHQINMWEQLSDAIFSID